MADKNEHVQVKNDCKVEMVSKENPMLLVKSKDMPTKLEFAQEQNKNKQKGE